MRPLVSKLPIHALAVLVLAGVQPEIASAQTPYTFTAIADSRGPFSSMNPGRGPAINAAGTVAFWSFLDAGGMGIFTGNGGSVTTVITHDGFGLSDPAINNSGIVAFFGSFDGPFGIFTASPASLTAVALGSGPFFQFGGTPAINSSGAVSFMAEVPEAIVLGSAGALTVVADTAGPAASFAGATTTSLNDSNIVAFKASALDAGGSALFKASAGGSLVTIADTNGPLSFLGPFFSINNAGAVAFAAELDGGGSAVLVGDGGPLTRVADTASGTFSPFCFETVAINDAGVVAFKTRCGAFHGIFTGPDPVADKVIAVGDTLDGATVTNLYFSRFGLNASGQIAFGAELSNGREGIYRADPPLPPPMPVVIDIKPDAVVNTINPRSRGVIAIAILGTPEFDAATVDVVSVRFGPGGATAEHPPRFEDVNADGRLDLMLHFSTVAAGIACGDTAAGITGKTTGGVAITGADSIETVGCR